MNILKSAAAELGIKEINGQQHNDRIITYAQETGIDFIDNDEIAWCSTFVNWCAQETALPISGKANARSWLNVGIKTQQPEPGDIVVFWRESIDSWKGHVAIFMGFNHDGSRVFCLGGNQSDTVSITDYDTNKVLGYRRLQRTTNLRIPSPDLKRGDKGQEVMKLQTVLNHINYNCGDVDGDFGKKTQDALRLLQADNLLLVNGIYNTATKDGIESILQA